MLSNPEKRAKYDRYGHRGHRGRRRRAALPRRQRHLRRFRRHLRRCLFGGSLAAAADGAFARGPTSVATSRSTCSRPPSGTAKVVQFDRHEQCATLRRHRRRKPAPARSVPLLRRQRPGGPIDRHLLDADRPAPRAAASGVGRSAIRAPSAAARATCPARHAQGEHSGRRRRARRNCDCKARASRAPTAARRATATASSACRNTRCFSGRAAT